MQEDEESAIDYAKLKEKAHDRETWRQWERTCLLAESTNNNNSKYSTTHGDRIDVSIDWYEVKLQVELKPW